MYSSQLACIVNLTSNKIGNILETQELKYKFLFNFIPIQKFKKIKYFKKPKEIQNKEDINLKIFATQKQLSTREILLYQELIKK